MGNYTFGDRLRKLRNDRNMMQSDVAEKLGCAATCLTNWERDKIKPPLDMLSKLCRVYEVSPLLLLERYFGPDELKAIAMKPYEDRSYEELIALNFSVTASEDELLKPCPFCGSKNIHIDKLPYGISVTCYDCLAYFTQAEVTCESDLINAWNRREGE